MNRRHRRILTAGHAVNAVVENNQSQINIAACCMNQVVAADSGAVTVTAANDNIQCRVSHFYTGSNRQSTAVQSVGGVEVQITGGTAGAADAADYCNVVFCQTLLINCFYNGAGDNAVARSRGTRCEADGPGGNIY